MSAEQIKNAAIYGFQVIFDLSEYKVLSKSMQKLCTPSLMF